MVTKIKDNRWSEIYYEGRKIPATQGDVTEEIEDFVQKKHRYEMQQQIKLMHLNQGALLKHEMEEKLEQLNSLQPSSLSQPWLEIAHELGLMADTDHRKTNFKERLHETDEEAKRLERKAKSRVARWKKQMQLEEEKKQKEAEELAEKLRKEEEQKKKEEEESKAQFEEDYKAKK